MIRFDGSTFFTLDKCPECKETIETRVDKFPFKDTAHNIACPYCKKDIVHVPKGTKDVSIFKVD